jgi:hypothetical protein
MQLTLPYHPLANKFPTLLGDEFKEFVADIKANGLLESITLFGGKILDGRNRYRACLALKLAPRFEEFKGDAAAALAFVISKNIARRHLKGKEKRAIIETLLKASPEKSDRQIAGIVKVSPTFVGKVRAEREAAGDVSTVDTRTDTKGRKQPAKRSTKKPEAKQPGPKPVKHDARVISPELAERVGRLAYRLVQLDTALALDLVDLILQRGVVERLWADLSTNIDIEGTDAERAALERTSL